MQTARKIKKLQGTYPVIFLIFASVKARNLADAKTPIKMQIANLYEKHRFLLSGDLLSDNEKKMELLLKEEPVQVIIDEQIIFNQLDKDEDAIWSLMLANGITW